ncbi:MAG: nicotinate-nucleotide adenylyltransferase [Anaerolineae bacterium]
MSRRLGVLGGTFDPIHYGHLVAAQETHYQLELERVLLVPVGQPPHKLNEPLSPAEHRVRMIELAIEGRPQFALSRVDVDRPGPQYTADTLALLREEWGPDTRLFFIAGSDSLADILHWRAPRQIVREAELAVVRRPGGKVDVDRLARELPGLRDRLHWVQMPLLDISSTGLQARVRQGRPISFFLPPAVEAYILEQGLYR